MLIKEENDIEKKWSSIKETMKNATKSTLGQNNARERRNWFNEECILKIGEKNMAKKKWLGHKELQSLEEYTKN